MPSGRPCNTSKQADSGILQMKKNHSFRDCASPTQTPVRRSTCLRTTTARRAICTSRSSDSTQPGSIPAFLEPEETQQLLSETVRLKQIYSRHIEIEETIVFARAGQVLDSQAIAAIGTEFRLRRKLP
jgi:hypothetical protein